MSMTISGDTGITFPNASTQTVSATTLGYQTAAEVTASATTVVNNLSLGVGQTWQTPSRSAGVTYTNTTGKPILIIISGQVNASNTQYTYIFVNSVQVAYAFGGGGAAAYYALPYSVIVPPGSTYSVTNAGGISVWVELR